MLTRRFIASLLFVAACSSRSGTGENPPLSRTLANDARAPTSATPAPAGATGCAGPARADLTPARVSAMLQGDDDYPVAEMRALGPGVIPALVELAVAGQDSYSRSRAISILGDLGCRDAAPAVEAALSDPDPLIRLPATGALAELLGADATPALTRMLSDSDTGVLKFTIKALGRAGDARAVAPLDQFRGTTHETWLRDLAAQALAEIRSRI